MHSPAMPSRWESVREFADIVAERNSRAHQSRSNHALQIEWSGDRGYRGGGTNL